MSTYVATADQVLVLLRQLPPREQLRVVSKALPALEKELFVHPRPRKSLRGLWRGLTIGEEEIAEIRREMWEHFGEREF
ncbi:MAG: hypothetical protein ISS49_03610 [Anaerolineae bacterium]|nr:hypothetical protein [Anaerolineae bacterium]